MIKKKKKILFSVGQECGSGFAEWFWLRASLMLQSEGHLGTHSPEGVAGAAGRISEMFHSQSYWQEAPDSPTWVSPHDLAPSFPQDKQSSRVSEKFSPPAGGEEFGSTPYRKGYKKVGGHILEPPYKHKMF